MRKVTVAAVIVRVTMVTMTVMARRGAVRVKMLLLPRMTRTARSEKAPKGARIEQWLLIKMAAVAAVVAVGAMEWAAAVAGVSAGVAGGVGGWVGGDASSRVREFYALTAAA